MSSYRNGCGCHKRNITRYDLPRIPVGGHTVYPDTCMTRRRNLLDETSERNKNDENNASLSKRRQLQQIPGPTGTCEFCSQIDNPVQRENCEYDADVLGCETAKESMFPFLQQESHLLQAIQANHGA